MSLLTSCCGGNRRRQRQKNELNKPSSPAVGHTDRKPVVVINDSSVHDEPKFDSSDDRPSPALTSFGQTVPLTLTSYNGNCNTPAVETGKVPLVNGRDGSHNAVVSENEKTARLNGATDNTASDSSQLDSILAHLLNDISSPSFQSRSSETSTFGFRQSQSNSVDSSKRTPDVTISPFFTNSEHSDPDYDFPADTDFDGQDEGHDIQRPAFVDDPSSAPPLFTVRTKSTNGDYDTPKTSQFNDVTKTMYGGNNSVSFCLDDDLSSSALHALGENRTPPPPPTTDEPTGRSRDEKLHRNEMLQQPEPQRQHAPAKHETVDASQTESNNGLKLDRIAASTTGNASNQTQLSLVEHFKRVRLDILTTMSQLLKSVSQTSSLSNDGVKVALQQILQTCVSLKTNLLALDNFGHVLASRVPQSDGVFHASLASQLKSLQPVLGGLDECLEEVGSLSEVTSIGGENSGKLTRIVLVTKAIPVLLRGFSPLIDSAMQKDNAADNSSPSSQPTESNPTTDRPEGLGPHDQRSSKGEQQPLTSSREEDRGSIARGPIENHIDRKSFESTVRQTQETDDNNNDTVGATSSDQKRSRDLLSNSISGSSNSSPAVSEVNRTEQRTMKSTTASVAEVSVQYNGTHSVRSVKDNNSQLPSANTFETVSRETQQLPLSRNFRIENATQSVENSATVSMQTISSGPQTEITERLQQNQTISPPPKTAADSARPQQLNDKITNRPVVFDKALPPPGKPTTSSASSSSSARNDSNSSQKTAASPPTRDDFFNASFDDNATQATAHRRISGDQFHNDVRMNRSMQFDDDDVIQPPTLPPKQKTLSRESGENFYQQFQLQQQHNGWEDRTRLPPLSLQQQQQRNAGFGHQTNDDAFDHQQPVLRRRPLPSPGPGQHDSTRISQSELETPDFRASGISQTMVDQLEELRRQADSQPVHVHTVDDVIFNSLPVVATVHHFHHHQLLQQQQPLSENDRRLLMFYCDQIMNNWHVLDNAASAFFHCMERRQPPKVFITHSKFVILAGHKMAYIGNILATNLEDEPAQESVAAHSNRLCNSLKKAVRSTKEAALKYPEIPGQQLMVDCIKDVTDWAIELKEVIERLTLLGHAEHILI